MNRVLLIALIILSISKTDYLYSQYKDLSFQHISFDDGLPHSIVNDIYQDKKGFMWFTTGNGLCKYDGYNFTVFQNKANDSLSIPENNMVYIMPDSSGDIMCLMSIKNIIHFNIVEETFKAYPYNRKNIFSNILTNKDNYLWFISDQGIEKYNILHNGITLCYSINTNITITSFYQDSNGKLWIGSLNGLYYLDTKSNRILRYIAQSSFLNSNIITFFEDTDNILWVGTNKGIVKLNTPSNTIQEYAYNNYDELNSENSNIKCFAQDENNNLWVGTTINGVYVFNKKTGKFIANYKQGDKSGLSNNYISKIYTDNFNNIWIATINGGINKVNLNKKAFYTYHMSNKNEVVMSLFEDSDENIWVGTTNNGLYKFNRKTNSKKQYIHNSNNPNSIGGGIVGSITEDAQKNIWLSTWSGSLNKINPITNSIDVYKGGENDLYGWAFRTIVANKHGVFIGSVDFGLEFFNPTTKKSKPIKISETQQGVSCLHINDSNHIWIGTRHSVIKYNLSDSSYEFLHDKLKSNKQHNMIMSFSEKFDSTIWIGTEGDGLIKLNLTNNKLTTFNKTDGLPDNNIYGLHYDNNSNLWMSTNKGISKFNTKTSIFTNYTTSDGIQNDEFKWGAHYKCKNGDIMFGGINGFTIFTPNNIKDNPFPPTTVITDFKIFNKSINAGDTINKRILINKSIIYTDTILLNYDENDIAFEFSSLHYTNSKKNKYQYMLKGYDKDWIETQSNNRFAHYTNLSPGIYKFIVKTSNNDGLWNKKNATIYIEISYPWWSTLLFKILLTITILFSLYIVYVLRVASIKQQNRILEANVKQRTTEITVQKEELKKLNATKNKFFSIIAHDLKNPFHAISGLSELLRNQFHDISDIKKIEYLELINQSSSGASNLLDNLLQWASTQTNSIKFAPISFDINEIINSNIKLLQIIAKNKAITITNQIDKTSIIFADQDMITTVIRNLLNNAIKFTPKDGKITISYKNDNNKLDVFIKDNGIGMTKKDIKNIFRIDKSFSTVGTDGEQGTGIGLILCKEFVEKNNGNIKVISEKGKGSTFVISLPIH